MLKKWSTLITTALLIISIQSVAQTNEPVQFIGTDNNWFNPNNWDSGEVPDATTDIVLTNGQSVVIDPMLSPTSIAVIANDVMLNNATLTTLPNTEFHYNNIVINGGSLFDTQSSGIIGNDLEINRNGTEPGLFGMRLNPTTNDTRSVKITAKSAGIQMFLGGTIAASPNNTGVGHYATLLADDLELDGQLIIDTIYGFEPQVGDEFQMITARNLLVGQFNNLNEGDAVSAFLGVDLIISYIGGDGNDVVLTAVESDDLININASNLCT